MRQIVVLTRNLHEHRFVVATLCDRYRVKGILVDASPPGTLLSRARRYPWRGVISKALRTVYLGMIRDRVAREQACVRLFGESCLHSLDTRSGVVRVPGINSDEASTELGRLKPDILLVYGTGIVKPRILAHASGIALNMHTGISPQYRGASCAFWPIVDGQWEYLGATVHECTDQVDGGQIYEQRRVEVADGDGVHEVFARCVLVGVEAYKHVVDQYLAGTLTGVKQDLSVGRVYRSRDCGLGAEIAARRRLRERTRRCRR